MKKAIIFCVALMLGGGCLWALEIENKTSKKTTFSLFARVPDGDDKLKEVHLSSTSEVKPGENAHVTLTEEQQKLLRESKKISDASREVIQKLPEKERAKEQQIQENERGLILKTNVTKGECKYRGSEKEYASKNFNQLTVKVGSTGSVCQWKGG